MTNNLKPCPFCGGAVEIVQISTGHNMDGSFIAKFGVCCGQCDIGFARESKFKIAGTKSNISTTAMRRSKTCGIGGRPMTDLISRKALLESFKKAYCYRNQCSPIGVWDLCEECPAYDAYRLIISAEPAVQAEPVRRGKRTVYTIWHSSAWGEIHTKFECCGFDVRGTKKYNYCPNCGAKMGGDAT
jgi:hypothetical protein